MRREKGKGKRERYSGFALLFPFPFSLLPLFLACATVQDPPGGPPDLTPPVLVSITPDSGSVLKDLKKAAVLQFNEVISERPGVTLDQLIVVSPRSDALIVSWKRDAIEVRPKKGWRADVPYQLTLLPGVMDLRNNRLVGGRSIAFSTGGPIPATSTTGRALDWETGSVAAKALVEMIRLSDSLVFWAVADSTGRFSVNAVPPGRYVIAGTIDKNSNRKRDYREPFDSAVVTLDSTLSLTLWTFVHDTVGPRLRTAQRADSLAIRLDFNQPLLPGGPPPGTIRVRTLPDSVPVAVTAIQLPAAYDSARSTRAPAVTDSGAPRPPAPRPRPPAVGVTPTVAPGQRPVAAVDSATIALLATRPRLSNTWVVVLGEALRPGGRYIINAAVPNAAGAVGESTNVLVLPAEPARKDSTRADTTKARP